MIQIPYEQILRRIQEKTALSEAEITLKVDEKLKQLSGLISKEGAAHIIANQLGIGLFEKTSGRLEIMNILVGMRNVETVGKVQAVYEVRDFNTQLGSGKVGAFMLGDETGTIRVVMWGNQADSITSLKEGTIVKIQNGYVKSNNNRKEVHLNDKSRLIISPEGETVGEVKPFKRDIKRKSLNELQKDDINIEIVGTIIQAFEPRYFEICPKCGRRAKPAEDKFECLEHGFVVPGFSYVMNLLLDDGTDNKRVVCFRNQAQHLTKKAHDELMKYKDAPEEFEAVKTDLLGRVMKFIGRIKADDAFGRFDFIAEQVFEVNPEDEIKRLQPLENSPPVVLAEK